MGRRTTCCIRAFLSRHNKPRAYQCLCSSLRCQGWRCMQRLQAGGQLRQEAVAHAVDAQPGTAEPVQDHQQQACRADPRRWGQLSQLPRDALRHLQHMHGTTLRCCIAYHVHEWLGVGCQLRRDSRHHLLDKWVAVPCKLLQLRKRLCSAPCYLATCTQVCVLVAHACSPQHLGRAQFHQPRGIVVPHEHHRRRGLAPDAWAVMREQGPQRVGHGSVCQEHLAQGAAGGSQGAANDAEGRQLQLGLAALQACVGSRVNSSG